MRKAKVTSSEIIEKAIKLFSQKGIENVSMNEIARACGITKPLLYYYFKNKEDIVKSAFLERVGEMRRMFLLDIKDVDDIEDFIMSLLTKHYEFFSKNETDIRCFFRMLSLEHIDWFKKMVREIVDENRGIIKEHLKVLLKKHKKMDKEDIELISGFISAFLSYIIMELKMKRKVDLSLINRVVKLFLKGMGIFLISIAVFTQMSYSIEIDIDDAVRIAFERNISIQNAYTSQRIYLEKINEYYGSAYPQIDLNASYTKNFQKPLAFMGGRKMEVGLENSYSAGISLSQIIWSGGRLKTAIELAKDFAESAKENLILTRNAVKRLVKQLFWSVLYFKEMVKLKEELLSIEKEHFKVNEEKYKNGIVSDLVVMRSKVDVANREVELVKAKNIYEVGLLTFKDTLGIDISDELHLKGSFDIEMRSFDFEKIYLKALSNRPDYRLALLKKEMTEKQLRIEKGNHLPIVSLFLNRQFTGQNEKDSFPPPHLRGWSLMGGVNFKLPLFNGFATTSRVKQLECELGQREREVEDVKRKIRVELKRLLLDIEEAKKRADAQALSVKNASMILKTTEERYKAGVSSQIELNDATLLYSSARFGYLTAVFDYLSILADLEYAVGGEL